MSEESWPEPSTTPARDTIHEIVYDWRFHFGGGLFLLLICISWTIGSVTIDPPITLPRQFYWVVSGLALGVGIALWELRDGDGS